MAQMVKNLPTMQKTQVQSLGQEYPQKRDWLPTPVFLPGEFHGQRNLVGYSLWGRKRVRQDLVTKQQQEFDVMAPATSLTTRLCAP